MTKESKAIIHTEQLRNKTSKDGDASKLEALATMVDDLDKDTEKLMMTEEVNGTVVDHYKELYLNRNGAGIKNYSYQEKSVKDFLFKFKRKGILSDQVGMGKTIEAGKIICELAARRELDSLLILVPSAKMVQKWEKELANKFGIRNSYEDIKINDKVYSVDQLPKITELQNEDDVNALIFDAVDGLNYNECDFMRDDNLNEMIKHAVDTCYDGIYSSIDFSAYPYTKYGAQKLMDTVIRQFVRRISELLNKELIKISGLNEYNYMHAIRGKSAEEILRLNIDSNGIIKKEGKVILPPVDYSIYESVRKERPIAEGDAYSLIIDKNEDRFNGSAEFLENCVSRNIIRNSIVNEFNFYKAALGKLTRQVLNNDFKSKIAIAKSKREGEKFDSAYYIRRRLSEIATEVKRMSSVLIVSNENEGERFFLDTPLYSDYSENATTYMFGNTPSYYSIFDMLIDMRYATLIVDEAHNYIEVSNKCKDEAIKNVTNDLWKDYHLFELFYREEPRNFETKSQEELDGSYARDRYLITKKCLYVKLLMLSNRATRKIFMTATPIKSDMIDFYLLTLLKGDNFRVDSFIQGCDKYGVPYVKYDKLHNTTRELLDKFGEKSDGYIFNYLTEYDFFCLVASKLFSYLYRVNSESNIKFSNSERTLAKQVILYRIQSIQKDERDLWSNQGAIQNMVKDLDDEVDFRNFFERLTAAVRTEHIAKAIKEIATQDRYSFEKCFTVNGKQIKTIQQLVGNEDESGDGKTGLDCWRNMYESLGIRSTRHQTNMIADTWRYLFKPEQQKYYTELPMWSRRNGTVLYIQRDDRYFDFVISKKIEEFVNSLGTDKQADVLSSSLSYDESKAVATANRISQKYDELMANIRKESERQKYMQSFVRDIWNESYDDYCDAKKQIADDTLLTNLEKEKKYSRELRSLKKTVSEFLYKYVLDDGMKGVLSANNTYVCDFPDFYEGRLHILMRLILNEVEGLKSFDEKAKVLVFANDDVYDKLYVDLCAEVDYSKDKTWRYNGINYDLTTMSGKQMYKNVYNHSPMRTHADKWTVSDRVEDLNTSGRVLIVVPPKKYEEGIDLQKATHLINFDILHSPLSMEQRIGRIDRVKTENKLDNHDIHIYAFTPLNDWSGFSTVFLANYLKLFSRWNGDTTGIVSFPVGEEPNSSTFEGIVGIINDAYKILSDHVGGYDVLKVFKSLSSGMDSGSSPIHYGIVNMIKELKYIYDDNKYVGNDELYEIKKVKREVNLDDHIEHQAASLHSILENLSGILYSLNGDRLTVPEETAIIADLNFLYYQHFYMDLVAKNTIINPVDRRLYLDKNTRNEYGNRSTIIIRAIEEYFFKNPFLDEVRDDSRSHSSSARIRSRGSSSGKTDYNAQIKDRVEADANAYNSMSENLSKILASACSIVKEDALESSLQHVFNQYNIIINKYVDLLLKPYTYLCKQVKVRLDQMASIIKDGTVVDLIYAIDETAIANK